jgi:hypothetical protein
LGEFSPIGAVFFIKLQKDPKFFGYFFPRIKLWVSFTQNDLGYTMGDFFTSSSGHPAQVALEHWVTTIGRIDAFCAIVYFGQSF